MCSSDLVAEWLAEVGPQRVTLALDVRLDASGTPFVATHGWTQASTLTLAEVIGRFETVGLAHVLCTDIDRDGALTGPNVALYGQCVRRWPAIAFQASGGVRDARDLAALATRSLIAADAALALNAACGPDLNALMAMGPSAWSALRLALSRLQIGRAHV